MSDLEEEIERRVKGKPGPKPKPAVPPPVPSAKIARSMTANTQQLQQAQGALMAVHRMLGKNIAEIAEIFQVSSQTVNKRLTAAQSNGILQLTKDLISERLMPKAIAVYETKLEEGDLDAA